MAQIIETLDEISAEYDALLVDLWGCVHDGVRALPEAVAALVRYRAERGGAVVLVTNSPKPRAGVERQLDRMGVPRAAWDAMATSGDSARAAMFRGVVGRKVHFMGQDHDEGFFTPLEVLDDPLEIERVPLAEAEGIVCTGPVDPMADPEALRPELRDAQARGLKLLCANPDIVVDRGEVREWCAGAVAALYTEMGGESLYFGKPHPPIYDLAYRRLAALGREVPRERMLAIGDGTRTDVAGAMGEGIDSLYITGGLARAETKTQRQPDPQALERWLAAEGVSPPYAIGALR
jgi:HAD superfamily hydrolase (TIGR01459 family)